MSTTAICALAYLALSQAFIFFLLSRWHPPLKRDKPKPKRKPETEEWRYRPVAKTRALVEKEEQWIS
jgi:hypothetical protein